MTFPMRNNPATFKLLLILIIIAKSTLILYAQENFFYSVENRNHWDSILSYAEKSKSLIFADFYSDYCELCQEQEKIIFKDSLFLKATDKNFIRIKINVDSEYGYQMVETYSVMNIPTVLIVNWNGSIINRTLGLREMNAYLLVINYMDSLINHFRQLHTKLYLKNINRKEIAELSLIMYELNLKKSGKSLSDYYFQTSDDTTHTSNDWELIKKYYSDIDELVVINVLNEFDEYSKYFGYKELSQFFSFVFENSMKRAISESDISVLMRAFKILEIVGYNENSFPIERLQDYYLLKYFEGISDWNSYFQTGFKYLNFYNFEEFEANEILTNVYLFSKEYDEIKKADYWARKVFKKHQNFENSITYALTSHRLKKFKKMNKLLNIAEKFASSEEQIRLLKKIRDELK